MNALERNVIIGFIVAIAVLLAMGGLAVQSTLRLTADASAVKHAQEVLTRLKALLATATAIQSGQRGYVITGDESYLEQYHAAEGVADGELEALRRLIRDPAQLQKLEQLEPLIQARREISRQEIDLRRDAGFDAARAHILEGGGRATQLRIRRTIDDMVREEQRLLEERERISLSSTRITLAVIAASGGVAVIFGGAALYFVQRGFAARKRADEALKRTNEELRIATAQAQAADRVKSAFLATMSHELRTPLNSIIGFTGVLLQRLAGPLNEEQAKQLGIVQASARHLLALINDVLDISKIEAGELRLNVGRIDLRALIERVIDSVRAAAESKGLTLRAQVADTVGEAVSDERRIAQVLLNLLNNAIKFTEHGEVLLRAAADGDRARLEVADTGIGIKPQDMTELFKPFKQIDAGLARAHEGTGLGLAICRRLASLLGGDLHARSEWGKGSVFTFTFPLSAPQ